MLPIAMLGRSRCPQAFRRQKAASLPLPNLAQLLLNQFRFLNENVGTRSSQAESPGQVMYITGPKKMRLCDSHSD